MIVQKYYDNNNHIVGFSCGNITEDGVDTTINDIQALISLFSNYSEKKDGQKVFIIEDNNFMGLYKYVYEDTPQDELSDNELKQLLKDEILNSVVVGKRPVEGKEGFHLVPKLYGTTIIWEFEEDENYHSNDNSNLGDGTYLHPISYINGLNVETGKWYTDNVDIWEAVKDGVPENFNDKEYFDIID